MRCTLRAGFCDTLLVIGWSVHWCRDDLVWDGYGWFLDFKWRLNKRSTLSVLSWSAFLSLGYRITIAHFWCHSLTYLIFLTNALGTELFFGRRDKDNPLFHKHLFYALLLILFIWDLDIGGMRLNKHR